jgi:hypothetical protein
MIDEQPQLPPDQMQSELDTFNARWAETGWCAKLLPIADDPFEVTPAGEAPTDEVNDG